MCRICTYSSFEASAYQGRQGGGRGGGGGGGRGCSCIQAGIVCYQGKILDTGTPPGGPAYGGAPAPFVNMNALYPNNNVILTHDWCYIVPARNGIATGAQYERVSACPNARGWGWVADRDFGFASPSLADMLLAGYQGRGGRGGAGRSSSGGGGSGEYGTGYCGGNFRRQRMQIQNSSGQWVNDTALIDTGTATAMFTSAKISQLGLGGGGGGRGGGGRGGGGRGGGFTFFQGRGGGGGGGGGRVQVKFDPNPEPISMPYGRIDQGQGNYFIPCPTAIITQRVQIILTNDYTILYSVNGNASPITYECRTGKAVAGDVLKGQWAPRV